MKGYVYILRDQQGRYYVGSTTDIARRMRQHGTKQTRTTARMDVPSLVLVQEYDSLFYARNVERQIKKLKRKDYIDKMVTDGCIKISPRSSTPTCTPTERRGQSGLRPKRRSG